MDSCDVSYLFDDGEAADPDYHGNLTYQYNYRDYKGAPFPWLFVDFSNLKQLALRQGLRTQMLYQQGEHYLARMTKA